MADRNRSGRVLTAAEVAAMAKVDALGDSIKSLITELRDPALIDPKPDGRWLSIATTHMQHGLMALNRAIARPEGF